MIDLAASRHTGLRTGAAGVDEESKGGDDDLGVVHDGDHVAGRETGEISESVKAVKLKNAHNASSLAALPAFEHSLWICEVEEIYRVGLELGKVSHWQRRGFDLQESSLV